MADQARTIIAAGDLSVEWLQTTTPASDQRRLNWQQGPSFRRHARPGGALLLARFLEEAVGTPVITYRVGDLEQRSPEEAIHAIRELAPFPRSNRAKGANGTVYRIQRFCGFAGPSAGVPALPPLASNDPAAALVVLNDADNGFRDAQEAWPAALTADGAKPTVLLKMSRSLASGALWDLVRSKHLERLVVVIDADDLRASGVQISRVLSWERTATDFVWQLASNRGLITLANCPHLVVLFGLDGAIYHRQADGKVETRLYYDPTVIEGGFQEQYPGSMIGKTSAFVAAFGARVYAEGLESVGRGINDGIRSARRLLRDGFGSDPAALDYPRTLFRDASGANDALEEIPIPPPSAPEPAVPTYWRILREKREGCLEDIAYALVREGNASALQGVPQGRFNYLRTVDRAEIESYRSVQNLMREYLAREKPKRPLSIAVFGPPGSGKSFGVEQVAQSVAPGQIEALEFNVSQFETPANLISALHRVRDVVLGGKVPLVFFDEFDSGYEGRLGWLRYFLAPMQDGTFKDGESVHPIGKAIFVFAGGTCKSFDHFSGASLPEPDPSFVEAKGPDFVSRLRGYVNVMGPNPLDDADEVHMVRRAILLRSLIERKARHLIDGSRQVRIDEGVLRAMMKVPRYKHGVRSMEAVLDMSSLAGRARFEQAALPSPDQLKLHVDAELFTRLVVRDVLFGGAREALARAIHERFRRDHKDRSDDDPAMQPWDRLREDLKESNRQQADHIPVKLHAVGYRFGPAGTGEPQEITFTPEEIEIMAEMEHDRWVSEKRLDGYVYDDVRDHDKKTSPYLVPWQDLSDEVKQWDRDTVQAIPELMADAGFEIYRC